jgi:hypothetical protein
MNYLSEIIGTSVRTNINNNEASARGAMPMKDNSSDGTNMFSMFRHRHAKIPAKEIKEKKWYGNSRTRDSSVVNEKRNTLEVGLVTKNADHTLMSFTAHTSKNDVNQAKQRVRNRGYVVHKKIIL